jgi:hypothetical protein
MVLRFIVNDAGSLINVPFCTTFYGIHLDTIKPKKKSYGIHLDTKLSSFYVSFMFFVDILL